MIVHTRKTLKGKVIQHSNLKRHQNKKICGIYFLFDSTDTLIYIGQSTDILARIQQHNKDKVFSYYSYYECSKASLNNNEKACIEHYKPKMNETFNTEKIETSIDIPLNTAFIDNWILYVNLLGKKFTTKVIKRVNKKGQICFRSVDYKVEFINDGSFIIKKFYLTQKGKAYVFNSNGKAFELNKDLL